MALSLTMQAQNPREMNESTVLTPRQLFLAECACLEARGDMERLDAALRRALAGGVTVNELKEAFSQLYAYTGFPRSLNALNKLKAVHDERKAAGIIDPEGKPWSKPAVWDNAAEALRQGTEVQSRLVGGRVYRYDFSPQNEYYLKSHLFGDIFAGDLLSPADRELVTVAALSGMKGVESQLASHKRGAVAMGNTPQQVDALCAWLDAQGLTLHSEFERGNANAAYAQYFKGSSYLAPLIPQNLSPEEQTAQAYSNVTFEPGCRNNWHIHHADKGGGQMLLVTAGYGWYQEYGQPARRLEPGDVVHIPTGVKHWHGAAKDRAFQHLAIEVPGENCRTEWCEPVSDDEYDKLK